MKGVWTPLSAGSRLKLWIDPTDNSKITTATGVSQIVDKSASAHVYAQATGSAQPTLGSMNGLQCLVGNNAQFLTQSTPSKIISTGSAWVMAVAFTLTATAPSNYPGIWSDGNNSDALYVLGVNTSDANYRDLFSGHADGSNSTVPEHRYGFSLANGHKITAILSYNGSGATTVGNYSGRINTASVTPTATGGGYGTVTTTGGIFYYGVNNRYMNGKIGDIVFIQGPTAEDTANLITFMERRWGAATS